MQRYRIEVGHNHGVKPGNIVGAIANEAGLDSEHIGRIDIRDDHTLIDLPVGMPKPVFRDLRKVWVCGRQLAMSRVDGEGKPVRKVRKRAVSSSAPSKTVRKKRNRGDAPPKKRKVRKR